MMIRFRSLFTIGVVHTYYSGPCKDFQFIVPADTERLLGDGRVLTKQLEGKLYAIFEADESDHPLVRLGGSRVRLGLKLNNPYFSNFTDTTNNVGTSFHVYRNADVPNRLSAPEPAMLTGGLFSHPLSRAARPVMVQVRAGDGAPLHAETVVDADISSVPVDMRGTGEGAYIVEEIYPSETTRTDYYVDAELLRHGAAGVVEIEIHDSFYTSTSDFTIEFDAKKEILNYYVVAKNYRTTDIGFLAIADAGSIEEEREKVEFTAVRPDEFTDAELSPSLLESDDALVVLFKSDTSVARRERGRKKIQLSKNGDVLIAHLPQPGANRADANMIIHISKQ